MNDRNVAALIELIAQGTGASPYLVRHLAEHLAARGVLVPASLKNSDLDWLESFRYPTYAEKRAFLADVARGVAAYPLVNPPPEPYDPTT